MRINLIFKSIILFLPVAAGFPVKDKLLKGDLLTTINNEQIFSASEFIATLRKYDIGETVTIGLTRDIDGVDTEISISTQLIEHIEYDNEPMVGFLATTVNERFA